MLLQRNIVKKYLSLLSEEQIAKPWAQYQDYFLNEDIQANIHKIKEEQFQEGFLRELFVKVLGYTINPSPNYNLTTELKNEVGSKKSDGAIQIDNKVIGVIELKDHKTPDLASIETQAFGYKNKHKETRLVIISNFEKLRLYIDNAVEYREWDIFHMTYDDFRELYLCLAWTQVERGIALQMKEESVSTEDQITNALYKDYSQFKRVLFADIVSRNPYQECNQWAADDKQWQLLLFKKTQKLLDRLLFIFFAEDCLLLTPNSMSQIVDKWKQLKELDAYVPLYNRIKQYFGYLDTGHQGKPFDVYAYNGGLFKPDEVLDSLTITDDILAKHTLRLSAYDFKSDVDVNILGHIFENSLSEIEEVTQQINSGTPLPIGEGSGERLSKRKQDGVFYTPQYITKYIVENTVGRLCAEKKRQLNITEDEYFSDQRRQLQAKKRLLDQLQQYRQWLLEITILDPACGSGAFLNAALQFLMAEHKHIDEMEKKISEFSLPFEGVENYILENNLYGVDINEESVGIAQLALWLRTAKPHRKLNSLNQNIKCGNSLISDPAIAGDKAFDWQQQFPQVFEKGGFDVVIGNPPYVTRGLTDEVKEYINKNFFTAEYQLDLYVCFMEKAVSLVKECGYNSFIVPNSWLKNMKMYKCREFMLNKFNLTDIVRTYNVFAEASVDTLIYIGNKSKNEIENISIREFVNGDTVLSHNSLKNRFRSNDNLILDIEVNDSMARVLKKMRSNVSKVKELFDVCRGINPYDKYTGQSPEIISSRAYHADYPKDETFVPELKGRHIDRYSEFWDGHSYISYGDWLAAPREHKYFTGERIVFREILGRTLISTIITKDIKIDRSLYIALPLNNSVNIYYVEGILNSQLLSTYFRYSNNEFDDLFPKMRVAEFRELPIKNATEEEKEKIAESVKRMLSLNKQLQQKRSRFLRRLSDNFEGVKITTALQQFDQLDFKGLMAELKKQKLSIPLKQQDEWEDFFCERVAECQALSTQIKATDEEIDNKVFDLYGLTEEERKIVMTE